jgi:hypothetical protein
VIYRRLSLSIGSIHQATAHSGPQSVTESRSARVVFQNPLSLSASIAVYRPQAEVFGGRSDGKFGLPLAEVS